MFSDGLYEYACCELLARAREKGYGKKQLGEIRACLQEGLARADYLLAAADQLENARQEETVHGRNYWKVMRKLGELLR